MVTDADLPEPPSCAFASDNAAGAHPQVLDAVVRANAGHALAYGEDEWTRRCADGFSELFGREVVTRLTFNGTGANLLALGTALGTLRGPNHAVVCTTHAHIDVDETGAPERVLGSKLLALDAPEAKLTPALLRTVDHLRGVQHHAQPGVVSITQATELGTLYTAGEVAALCATAHDMGMLVHLDGARIANATAALGGDRRTLRSFTVDAGVDVVSFGGTKNGLLGAEAVVFLEPDVARGSEYVRKQVTQLPSKMRFLAAQFEAVLADDLWIATARHANTMATALHERIQGIAGLDPGPPPAVNSLFPILPRSAADRLRDWCFFWDWDPGIGQVRWMTAWDTTLEDVERFADGVRTVMSGCRPDELAAETPGQRS